MKPIESKCGTTLSGRVPNGGNGMVRMGRAQFVVALVLMAVSLLPHNLISADEPSQTLPQDALTASGRLPFPEVGEVFERPLLAVKLADESPIDPRQRLVIETSGIDAPIIPWHEAQRHMGSRVTVEGTIVVARRSGTICFLNFTKDWRGKFYVIVFEEALADLPLAVEEHFLNQTVHVTGVVKEHRGSPQIQVEDARQIRVVNPGDQMPSNATEAPAEYND